MYLWFNIDSCFHKRVQVLYLVFNFGQVYKWMMQQSWHQFDFALATRLADYMGKERKFSKCREIFDDIINQGRVPCESTFHILIVAYLSVTAEGCLEEACSIYNRMIQLGGYQPRLSLHNSLFKSIVSKPGISSKHYLKQAEFIFHNLVTTGLDIHKEIYAGLIWLHSYQETVDKERIAALRKEMQQAGIKESRDVLVSILRACSRDGDLEEAEKAWAKLLHLDGVIPSPAFVYRMEIFAKVRDPRRSLAIFKEMKEHLGSINVVAYHKIIEILCQAREVELAESAMSEFINRGLNPVMPAYIDIMNMYFNLGLNDKVELTFTQCLENRQPTRTVYSIYMDSLVKTGNINKAEEIFEQMQQNAAIGISARSCNIILSGYLSSEDYAKAEKIYKMMCQKKYEVESSLLEKMDIVLSLSRKAARRPVNPKLSKEQREILVGLLLGGLKVESDEKRKNHLIHFDFSETPVTHTVFKRHMYDLYHEWLHPSFQANDGSEDVPHRFFTVAHSYFGFYADQFWPEGRPAIPKLIHRWLSPCALAYWYMFKGHRTSSGDVLLKLRGSREGVEKVLKTLKAMSLNFRVKKKGRVFWIGFLETNSMLLWKVVEPYILDELKDSLRPGGETSGNDGIFETESLNFESGSDTDERASDYSDGENL